MNYTLVGHPDVDGDQRRGCRGLIPKKRRVIARGAGLRSWIYEIVRWWPDYVGLFFTYGNRGTNSCVATSNRPPKSLMRRAGITVRARPVVARPLAVWSTPSSRTTRLRRRVSSAKAGILFRDIKRPAATPPLPTRCRRRPQPVPPRYLQLAHGQQHVVRRMAGDQNIVRVVADRRGQSSATQTKPFEQRRLWPVGLAVARNDGDVADIVRGNEVELACPYFDCSLFEMG